tara:strand:- start:70 stop:285 length:216 start_codon:yes stop_codon:yes gene_type:complete
MKVIKEENKPETVERLEEVSLAEIKKKYPDKIVDAYVEGGRLVVVLDTCRIKFDERVPQKGGSVYGAIHRK